MGRDARRPNRLASEAGRLLYEARALSRGSARLAVRGAVGRARARVSGHEPSLRWSPSELAAGYDVVVVGAGLAGLFLADELARRSPARVALLDAEGVGIDWPSRAQTALSVVREHDALSKLVVRSADCYATLADRAFHLGFGHLDVVTLATTHSDLAHLEQRAAGNGASDGPSIVGPAEAAAVVPYLASGELAGALVEPNVTTVRTDTLPWELAGRAAAGGVAIVEGCRLTAAARTAGAWVLSTSVGRTEAPVVVDATAAAEVLLAAGVDERGLWRRWETLTTDPVQPFLAAQIRVEGVEIHQSVQGEIRIEGQVRPGPPGAGRAWLSEAATLAAAATAAVPPLAQLRLASRAWRSDRVPLDGLPAVGPVATPGGDEGLHRLGGLGADPLAFAPAAAEALAGHLADEPPAVALEPFEPGRRPGWLPAASGSRMAATAR